VNENGAPVRYHRTQGQVLRGVPHLIVGVAVGWPLCRYAFGNGPLTVWAFVAVMLFISAFWWFILWPLEETEIIGTVLRFRTRYGSSEIDLAEVTDISAKFVPFSGTSIVMVSPDNKVEIPRENRQELLAVGAVIREMHPRRVFSTRVERALGLGPGSD
jgi:hypothetical protein